MGYPALHVSAEPQVTSRTFGKYELLSLIARGGMGEVYLATLRGELGFEKKLVVKTIRPELAENPKFVDLFAAEAKTAVALTHGNIVPIYELGRSDDTLYIAMGWVDGPSVSQLLKQHAARTRRVDVATALFIVREVLTGLAYAHTGEPDRPPVVHRDISPRNILIDRSGQVRIVDFGIALPAEVTVTMSAGSTGYMAPEQARAAAAAPNADVFSVGCLLYELLTGEKAFPSEGVWVSPDTSRLPEPLRPILERALSLEPGRRPEHAGAFLRELSPLIAALAPTYTTQDLADHLREFFPRGWDSPIAGEPVSGTPATPATAHTETFATRLTAVVPDVEPEAGPDREDAPGDTAAPALAESEADPTPAVAPPASASSGSRWLVGGVAAIAIAIGVGVAVSGARTDPEPPPTQAKTPRAPASTADPAPTPVPAEAPEPEPPVEFVLEVGPADVEATVRADGEKIDGPPFVLQPPETGAVHVVIEAKGHRTQAFDLMPDDRGRAGTPVDLVPLQDGKLEVFAPSVSYAYVYVDNKRLKNKNTPLRDYVLPEGKHTVKVVCPAEVCGNERKLFEKRIVIEPKQTTRVDAHE
jgi:serine/threonine-protein kinase